MISVLSEEDLPDLRLQPGGTVRGKTLLIDKEDRLGGDCLHYGCVPSKTLIKTAHVYHLMKNASSFGISQHEIVPIDFRDVASRIKSVIELFKNMILLRDSAALVQKLNLAMSYSRTNEQSV